MSDELDRILDDALGSYGDREPRPGLERRVLARVAAARPGRRLGWWWVAAGATACACIATGLLFRDQPVPPPDLVRLEQPVPVFRVVAITPVVLRRAVRPALPKQEMFPAPAPLTAEERAMLQLAERFPKQALELTARQEKPIAIPEIEIKPLEDGSE